MPTRKFTDASAETTACGRDDFFFAPHLILAEKLDICVPVRHDLFFTLHLILGGKLDICVHDNLCVCSSLNFGAENWTSVGMMTFKEQKNLSSFCAVKIW